MTRAGDKLYREPDDGPQGSVLWAFVSHPETRRGFRDVAKAGLYVMLIAVLLGLG